jgi:hypothetical protein
MGIIYGYRCRDCGQPYDSYTRAQSLGPCQVELPANDEWGVGVVPCPGTIRREYSISVAKSWPTDAFHSTTTGTVATSKRVFLDDLRRQSDAMSARLGMTVNYQPIDPREAKSELGVTDEGLDSTYDAQRKAGKSEGALWL